MSPNKSETGVVGGKIDELVTIIEKFMSDKSKEKKSVRKVVSIMSRHLVKEGQLEFERGEIFLVVQDNGAWLTVINEKTGDQGLIPSNYCAPGNFRWYILKSGTVQTMIGVYSRNVKIGRTFSRIYSNFIAVQGFTLL